MGLGQTDKKLIMNIDVKRMGRGHARDTFFLPHDTSEHPFGKDQNIRRETQTCNDPVPIYSLLHSHQSIRLITLRASFACSAAVSFSSD